MADDIITLRIEQDAAYWRAIEMLRQIPDGIERAKKIAMRRLMAWISKQAIREASAATGIPQKVYKTLLRYWDTYADGGGIRIWIGTDPLKVHNLGTVTWRRRMRGARAGRKSYPGTWSWGPGSKTGPAVMYREGSGRLPIDAKAEEIHQAVQDRMRALEPDLQERLQYEMHRALRSQLFREGRLT